jgi:type IX secretion system PorP/SprF family membrane protein
MKRYIEFQSKSFKTNAMKRFLLAFVMLLSVSLTYQNATAQQLPQFTQYMLNNYIVNPAVAGIYNYYQIRSNNRWQWTGLTDAPQTYSISAYGPHNRLDMGFGGHLFSDLTGPTGRFGMSGTYSYNQKITQDIRAAGGLSLGFLMFRVDGSKFDLGDLQTTVPDPALFANSRSFFTPDASLGVMFYTTFWFAGLSAHQLFGQRIKFVDQKVGINRLKQHLMLSGGVLVPLNRDWEFEPSTLVKYMFGSPVTADLNAKFTYRKQFWGGLSLRWSDGAALVMGMTYDNRYMFGYSYDYSFTSIRKHQFGSHEIMIAFLFDKLK